MGRQKRKNNSPLLKETGKTPRTGEHDSDDAEDGSASHDRQGDDMDVISDLKEFIRMENERSNRALTEELRRHNDEMMTALENSLSFALTTNETLAKRLSAVEQRARQAEQDLFSCASRLAAVEEQLDLAQQWECRDWLIFSGPAISRMPKAGRDRDATQLLHDMVRKLMDYEMDTRQLVAVYREEKQIRVRFNTVTAGSDRHFLVRNKTRLRGTGLYIRERLTPFRQRIFNDMLQLKRNKQISTVFTKEGTVFVVVDRGDRPRPVRSDAAVERLVQLLTERDANQTGEQSNQSHQPASGRTNAPSRRSMDCPSQGTEGADVSANTDGPHGAAERHGSSPNRGAPSTGLVVGGEAERGRRWPTDPFDATGDEQSRPGAESVLPGRSLPDSSAGRAAPGTGSDPADRSERRTAPGESGRLGAGGDDGAGGGGGGSRAVPVKGRGEGTSTPTSGVPRRRFGGDIRRYVSGYSAHSKRD